MGLLVLLVRGVSGEKGVQRAFPLLFPSLLRLSLFLLNFGFRGQARKRKKSSSPSKPQPVDTRSCKVFPRAGLVPGRQTRAPCVPPNTGTLAGHAPGLADAEQDSPAGRIPKTECESEAGVRCAALCPGIQPGSYQSATPLKNSRKRYSARACTCPCGLGHPLTFPPLVSPQMLSLS